MRKIFKYLIEESVLIPKNHKVVLVDQQNGDFYIWVEFEESDAVEQVVYFRVFGTGHLIPDGFEHVHSYIEGQFVWHIYKCEK